MLADLHLHSVCSDGRLTPTQVIDAVADAGIKVAALTDHDTIAGLEEAALRAKRRNIAFLYGIEMTTYACGQVVHVLGLGFNPDNSELHRANAIANEVWARNQKLWVQNLESQGYAVNYDRDFSDGPVRLPILIERLCRKGVAQGDPRVCHSIFRKFFSALPAVAYGDLAAPQESARILGRAGGVAILAHPFSLSHERFIREICAQCDGLEALYAAYNLEQQRSLLELGNEMGKIHSCGSDYHGYFTEPYSNPNFEMPAALARRLSC